MTNLQSAAHSKPADPRTAGLRPKLIAASVAAAFALSAGRGFANPVGPTGVIGVSGITGLGTANVTVTTNANAVINWQGFSIGVSELTRFIQPSALNSVLNRVTGTEVSQILGALQSNGHVYLLNANGIVFGAGAKIDVAGLVASTLSLSDADFLAGKLRFAEVPGAGGIVNAGTIETPLGGRVFLVAPNVENSGVIRSPQGEIVLAAGKSVDLLSENSPEISVRVNAGAGEALNLGSLLASSGKIGVFGALVRHAGVAEASGATVGDGGVIRFVATKDLSIDAGSRVAANGANGGSVLLQAEGGTNLVAGTVEAKGTSGTGGTVHALGVRVGVVGNGVIDASGETGGGTVLVGGDFQGKNPGIQNAEQALIGKDGVIRVDAGSSGDGGRAIVWSDDRTQFYGTVSARGGSQSGNGGFVEISGKQSLVFRPTLVDTRAPNGQRGTLLLDPNNILIKNGTNDGDDDDGSATSFDTISYGGDPSIIWESELEGTAATTAVTVTASNSIVIEDLADNVLSLAEGGSFTAGAGGITMLSTNDTIATDGHSLSFSTASGGAISLGHLSTVGSVTSGSNTSVTVNAAGNLSVGNITTGNTFNDNSLVQLESATGSVMAGSVVTGFADQSSKVLVAASASYGGSITIGSITTGEAQDTSVSLTAPMGSVTVNGSIQTGTSFYGGGCCISPDSSVDIVAASGITVNGSITTGDGFYTGVSLNGGSGAVTVSGAILTGASTDTSFYGGGSFGSDVNIQAGLGITVTGPIVTGFVQTDGNSTVNISASAGSILTGDIITSAAPDGYSDVYVTGTSGVSTGSIFTGPALQDSNITVSSSSGSVSTGALATGNSDLQDSRIEVYASSGSISTGFIATGSAVNGSSLVYLYTNTGSVTVNGPITTGFSDWGSNVEIHANGGAVNVFGPILTGAGADGGESYVYITADGSIAVAGNILTGPVPNGDVSVDISSESGSVSTGGIFTGNTSGPSSEGYVSLDAAADIIVNGPIVTRALGPTAPGGGDVFLGTDTGRILVAGEIDTRGFDGGSGSFGGSVTLNRNSAAPVVGAPSVQVDGKIMTAGGAGGVVEFAGAGGDGGHVLVAGDAGMVAGDVFLLGGVDTHGGNGANAVAGSGGSGGHGGDVTVLGTGNILIGSKEPPPLSRPVAINTSGGFGGAGAGGPGGAGGDAGHITIDPASITIGGVIQAFGGPGGPGTTLGAGGSGGDLVLDVGAAGFITFVNAYLSKQEIELSLYGDGGKGTLSLLGNLIFLFTGTNDPLKNQAVAQIVGSAIKELSDATSTESSESDEQRRRRAQKETPTCK